MCKAPVNEELYTKKTMHVWKQYREKNPRFLLTAGSNSVVISGLTLFCLLKTGNGFSKVFSGIQ